MEAIKILQLGYGNVGKAFEALIKHRADIEYLEMIRSKDVRFSIFDFRKIVEKIRKSKIENRTFIADLTASTETTEHLLEARRAGWGLLLANKNPLIEKQQIFDELISLPIGFSATVGAGLPAIPEIRRLKAEGHQITRLEACLSGSMGFLGSELENGEPFSTTIQRAVDEKYTEPDPRIDLTGGDVAKKLLILSRLAGYSLEFEQIEKTALFPDPMAELELPEFMMQLSLLDPILNQRVTKAHKSGEVLRFVAEMQNGKCQVGLKPVPKNSPLGELKEDQKRILIYTNQLDAPVIISGAGSGPQDTAIDLLQDLLTLTQDS